MKFTKKSTKTWKLDDLDIGTVFCYPDHSDKAYMVINNHDYFIDHEKITEEEIVFIDLEYGTIYTGNENDEVIVLNGSFVVTEK